MFRKKDLIKTTRYYVTKTLCAAATVRNTNKYLDG